MRRILIFGLLVLGLGGGGLFGLSRVERSMVYPFDARRVDPAGLTLPGVQERKVKSGGQTLIVWVAAPAPGQPVILYFHGNAGNLANRAGRFRQFRDRGYGLIAPAYRGSSGSTGKPSERALTRDAVRLWSEVDDLVPGLTASDVVIYGESLGAAVAVKLVAKDGVAQPGGMVLEAPFTSLPDVVRHLYPQLEPLLPRMKNIWDSRTHVTRLTAPLLVLHGDADQLIPVDMGQDIHDAAGSKDKTMIRIRHGGHNDVWRATTLPVLWRFIDTL